MTFRISPLPWRVEHDYVVDANNENILRAMPQRATDSEGNDLGDDDERARYQLQLAASAPALLDQLKRCHRMLSDWEHTLQSNGAHAAELIAATNTVIDNATTVDFHDGNFAYLNLARKHPK